VITRPSHLSEQANGMHLRAVTDDGHLMFVLWVLRGIHSEEARLAWVKEWLPLTASFIFSGRDFEALGAVSSDGSGSIQRPFSRS